MYKVIFIVPKCLREHLSPCFGFSIQKIERNVIFKGTKTLSIGSSNKSTPTRLQFMRTDTSMEQSIPKSSHD